MSLFGSMIRNFAQGETDSLNGLIFHAIMSDDQTALAEAVERARDNGSYSEDFLYDLEGLWAFRGYYYGRLDSFPQGQREVIESYDDEWTAELIRQLQEFEDEATASDLKIA